MPIETLSVICEKCNVTQPITRNHLHHGLHLQCPACGDVQAFTETRVDSISAAWDKLDDAWAELGKD